MFFLWHDPGPRGILPSGNGTVPHEAKAHSLSLTELFKVSLSIATQHFENGPSFHVRFGALSVSASADLQAASSTHIVFSPSGESQDNDAVLGKSLQRKRGHKRAL